ncbi:hypothetical protein [Streptomyces sp. NPDC058486]|uniref:hypothetical protein n=1 Tax=unclassified Streptomyces TaxID=2593676 RepID=UPI00365C6E64
MNVSGPGRPASSYADSTSSTCSHSRTGPLSRTSRQLSTGVSVDRVKVMDRGGPAAALFDEREPEQGAATAHQALDAAARIDSTLVVSRLNTLLNAARPYRTASAEDVRTRAKENAAARPTTVAA